MVQPLCASCTGKVHHERTRAPKQRQSQRPDHPAPGVAAQTWYPAKRQGSNVPRRRRSHDQARHLAHRQAFRCVGLRHPSPGASPREGRLRGRGGRGSQPRRSLMAGARYIDANILLRYLRNDIPDQSRRSRRLLEQVEQGNLKVVLLPQVLFEVVFTLNWTYKVPRADIRDTLRDILALPGIRLPNKTLYYAALDLFVQYNVPFVDAYIAAYMQSKGDREIYSWDATDFDKLPGITRLEP